MNQHQNSGSAAHWQQNKSLKPSRKFVLLTQRRSWKWRVKMQRCGLLCERFRMQAIGLMGR